MRDIVSPPGAVLVEFSSAEQMLDALARLRSRGYDAVESFAPFDVPGTPAPGQSRSWLPMIVFGGGFTGAVAAYAVQWYVNVRSYPLDIGGRPLNAVPAFMVPTFEGAVLLGAITAFVGFLIMLRFPRPWNPVFEIDGFDSTSSNRYWIAVSVRQKGIEPERAVRDLTGLHPLRIVRMALEP